MSTITVPQLRKLAGLARKPVQKKTIVEDKASVDNKLTEIESRADGYFTELRSAVREFKKLTDEVDNLDPDVKKKVGDLVSSLDKFDDDLIASVAVVRKKISKMD